MTNPWPHLRAWWWGRGTTPLSAHLRAWLENRSPHWPTLRAWFLAKHPTCAACGTELDLEVHHKIPVSVDPSRELDETNLITLCMYPTQKDHFHVGHLGNWKDYNRNVVKDAAFMLSRHHATRKHPPCLM